VCASCADYGLAAVHEFEYSGTLIAVLDADGNVGGTFTLPANAGITVGDTYSGTVVWDTENLERIDNPTPFVTSYHYRPATPTLVIDDVNRPLVQKSAVGIINDGDPNDPGFGEPYRFGITEAGFDLQPPFDFVSLYGDVESTGDILTEFILVTFDPDGLALSGTGLPEPLELLNHSFFVFLESIDGTTTAAGIGFVPEPATVALLGLGGLVAIRRRRV
jgi:hypothetical protein